MPFVTVRKRLRRSRVLTGIFRHHAFRPLRGRHLLSGQPRGNKEKRQEGLAKNHQEHSFPSSHACLSPTRKTSLPSRSSYAFLFTTSSMLVPKSLSITVAAFRPGPPVTDPPGCVVAPV